MQNISIGKAASGALSGHGHLGHRRRCWWGDNDDALSVKAIETAVEQGIQWIDTAPIYGLYHSETWWARPQAHRPGQGGALHQVRSGVAA